MFHMIGTMTSSLTGRRYKVDDIFPLAAEAQGYLAALQKAGYTAELHCCVTTAAGDVNYKIIVE